MPTGIMLRWNEEKGFGFIKPDDDGADLFCHKTGLLDGEGSVRDGDEVRFKVQYDDRKGKDRAEQVELVSGGGGRGGGRGRSRSRSPPRRSGGGGDYGGGGGGGGGGDSRPGDWDCPKCSAMVFASKSECFKCGEPKGGGGRGGGGGGGRDRRDRSRSDDRSRDRRRDRSYSR
ncbi:unnamed protein product [Polarella glacialis]|uniref:RanBP2-type domain-containing protein n=1 Tax=Polarella glacialis TaxID=89957 RepID=A0A813EL10_POLGL|nr:unnamed protein product [Polarella glacialis]CAE8631804.1 unnamed protein product [Polarella glacialis]